MKALVIDDNHLAMHMISDCVTSLGYTTYKARSAWDGLARYIRELPNLVVTDYRIGSEEDNDNGVLLVRSIREYERTAHVRAGIVLMSSELPNIDFNEAGIDAVYNKDNPIEELYSAIHLAEAKNKP